MIIADTNILSTFARIHRLELLFKVAETDALHLPPAVIKELKIGLNKGLDFLRPIVDGLAGGAGFHSIALTADERSAADRLPGSLNAGERESIAICSMRTGSRLLTNDKRAHNYCRDNRIASLDLKLILRRLWQAGHCTKDEIRTFMDEIEDNEPGMVIKGKPEILR